MNSKYYSIIKNLYLQNGIQPTTFNAFGIRNREKQGEDIWNDWIGFFTEKQDEIYIFKGTTDPGIYWTTHPETPEGVAHLCLGYQKDIWVIDKHRGMYTALCNRWNCNPTRIWRDVNKDTSFNASIDKIESVKIGLNCHRADMLAILKYIGKYSAGCQVILNPKEFDIFITTAINSGLKKFSYFLFDKSQIEFFNELV